MSTYHNDAWSLFGLTSQQDDSLLSSTQESIDESNHTNDHYLLECRIAALRYYREKKALQLLTEIDELKNKLILSNFQRLTY